MPQHTVMSYNIENMRKLFSRNEVRPEHRERAACIAETISSIAPSLLGVVEASDRMKDHVNFLATSCLDGLAFKVAMHRGRETSRGKQSLAIYYREPFAVIDIDRDYDFYESWIEDIDDDGIKEVCEFERRPLEVRFRVRGIERELLVILASFKSKGVFAVSDLHSYERLALANRKRLLAQGRKVRQRLDALLAADPEAAIVVMGDLNDEPGLDHFERQVGASAVETVTGNIHDPARIMHNTLWHLKRTAEPSVFWTSEYPDPIVANLKPHRAWLDHIFVSPGMLKAESPIRYIMDSGWIAEKTEKARIASDHFPIYCQIET